MKVDYDPEVRYIRLTPESPADWDALGELRVRGLHALRWPLKPPQHLQSPLVLVLNAPYVPAPESPAHVADPLIEAVEKLLGYPREEFD